MSFIVIWLQFLLQTEIAAKACQIQTLPLITLITLIYTDQKSSNGTTFGFINPFDR